MAFETGANAQAKPYTMYDMRNGRNVTIIEDMPKTMKPRVVKITGQRGAYEVARLKINTGLLNGEIELSENNWARLWRAMPAQVTNLKNVTIAYDASKEEFTFVCQDVATTSFDAKVPLNPSAKIEKVVADMKYMEKVGIEINTKVMTNICDAVQPGDALGLIKAAKDVGAVYEPAEGIYKAA